MNIVITEIPYEVNKANMVKKMDESVQTDRWTVLSKSVMKRTEKV